MCRAASTSGCLQPRLALQAAFSHPPTLSPLPSPPSGLAVYEANPWWAVKMDSARPVISVAIQTTSECACVADLVGARILVSRETGSAATCPASLGLN